MSYAVECPDDCKYRARPRSQCSTVVTCDFILIAGRSRGCDIEPYCKCYRKRGEKEKNPGQLTTALRKPRDRQPWDYEKGYRLYKLGLSSQQIADELKISKSAVSHRRQKCWNKGMP